MSMSREDIELEANRLIASIYEGRKVDPIAKPTLIAWMEQTNGLEIDQSCPFCNEPLSVHDFAGRAWTVNCPCGKSKNTFRGL
jgi:hypothetical protein